MGQKLKSKLFDSRQLKYIRSPYSKSDRFSIYLSGNQTKLGDNINTFPLHNSEFSYPWSTKSNL